MATKDEAFEGLDIPANLQDALTVITPEELMRFFKSYKARKLLRVEHAKSPEALTEIQQQCKMLTEIENFFLSLRQAVKNT